MAPVVGRYFPSQKSQEKVYLLLRRHWFTYVIFLLVTILLAIPLVVLIIYWFLTPEVFEGIITNILILGVSAYSLLIIGLLLYGFVDYYLDVYIVTNQRIVDIKQNGFFRREIAELHLHQVQDVKAKVKGAFPTLMHYGDIHIQTAGEKENFFFKSIPHPYRVSKMIVNLHESHVEQRFREFESIVEGGGDKNKLKKLFIGKSQAKNDDQDVPQDEEELEDIGSFGRETFSKSRKNTKKLFRDIADGSRGDTNGLSFSDEIEEEEKRMILEGLTKDESIAENSEEVELKNVGSSVDDDKKKKLEPETGELHENKEVDI